MSSRLLSYADPVCIFYAEWVWVYAMVQLQRNDTVGGLDSFCTMVTLGVIIVENTLLSPFVIKLLSRGRLLFLCISFVTPMTRRFLRGDPLAFEPMEKDFVYIQLAVLVIVSDFVRFVLDWIFLPSLIDPTTTDQDEEIKQD
jgi:hypothetical protein